MMISKAERTTNFILETVAPYFNKHGYTATSMADITKATGLTKGAIYGNFESKEDLSLKAFDYNIKRVVEEMKSYTSKAKSPLDKLYALTAFYRVYHDYTSNLGGCPILNVGVDANNNNPDLHVRVKQVITDLQNKMIYLIDKGKEAGQIKIDLDSKIYAKRIFSLMEGSIFMSVTMDSASYIKDMMNYIDEMIDREMTA